MAKLKVDAGELIEALQGGDFVAWYLDRETGEVIGLNEYDAIEEEKEIRERIDADETGRFVGIEKMESHAAFRIMAHFVDLLPDGRAADDFDDALAGNRPFRRFRETLDRHSELREQWFAFQHRRMREEARLWLEEIGIDAVLVNKYAQGA